ncbi:uncharacterized protein [Rutidosis leptorrhynchoides]|uniref:uncharacterized protein isoform X2 n=1 Tax=Rutidosis leptorrhynchoides TaxID=125765 RepID=UPI003A992C54
MAYLSLFFYAIVLILLIPATTLAKNNTDHLALLAIKSGITHDPQHVVGTWNTSIHFCKWEGVTCGRRHPRVTTLDLGSRGIVGSLSPHIGNLSFLRVIRLENNTFKSVIPPQIGNLFRLQKLILINNSFEGEVPASLSNCTRLNVLGLSRNKLVGKLPQKLGSLVNLEIITVHSNGFTGGIPSFLANLTSLVAISAADNHLGGTIPHGLNQLHNLQEIGFANNQLYGNKLTGNIPFSFSNCSNLVELSLAENGLTGKVDINFSKMPNLWYLALFDNILGSSEPDEMKFIDSMINCSKLEMLSVHINRFTGVLPSSIGNLSTQLTSLAFGRNNLYGPLPSGIGNLVKLERLSVLQNQFNGVIPNELGNLRNLKLLYLHYNNFTGNVPYSIGNLSLLTVLNLSKNRLKGYIPLILNNCRSLLSLDLSKNNLTGPIPVELFQLSSLSITLNLSRNHLVGPLPQEIGKLKSLTKFDLSQNDLVGEIPNTIGSCVSLESLLLDDNLFQGQIPPTMSALKGIIILNLSSNNFSGEIPRFLSQLNLSSLDLSFNDLEGEVPLEGIFRNGSLFKVNGNDKLCGGPPELRLQKCRKTGSRKSRVIFLVVIPLCTLLVGTMVFMSFLIYRRRRKTRAQPPAEASHVQPFTRVTYGSMLKATNEFSQQNLIGTGTFSEVYKCILEPDDGMVAIKVLKLENRGALKSFTAECEALKNIRHRNLVKIITSCSSIDYQGNDFRAIVYEFMPKGNLERWLHPSSEHEMDAESGPQRLSLHQRVTIATDVAQAIHYLHQDCEVPVIHCDLKPSNILLDSEMVARIGDFGLAKFLPLKPRESSTVGLRGTIGYAAPEYGLGSEMTKEGDIYSFGILLLEMITGKRPTDDMFQEGLNLHGYVKMAFPDRLKEIVESGLLLVREEADQNINYGYNENIEGRRWKKIEKCIVSLARIGLTCSMESPTERMNTTKVVHELQNISGIV